MDYENEKQEQSGIQKAADTAKKSQSAYKNAKKLKNAYSKAKKASSAGQNAKTAAKAGAKYAAGDVVGGTAELAKNETVQKIVIGIIATVIALIMMFFSAVTSVLYLPVEEDQGEHNISWVIKHPIAAIKSWFGFESDEYSLIDDNTVNAPGEEDSSPDGEADNNPTDYANSSMDEMMQETVTRYQKRYETVLKAIDTDFSYKQSSTDTNIYKIVNDPFANSSTTTEKEAVRLMSLFSAQTDGTILDSDFETYLTWLGEEDFFLWRKQKGDDDNDPEQDEWLDEDNNWNVRPDAWSGSMLSQPDIDKLEEWEEANPDDTYDTDENPENLFFTSALEQACALEPSVEKETFYTYEYEYDEEGNVDVIEIENINYTYTIKSNSSSGSSGILEFVSFQEAKDATNKAEPAAYRKENYEDMFDNTCEFFDINDSESILSNSSSSITSGSGGSGGSGLVAMALSQVGYLEKASNEQLDDFTANAGYANYTKYGRDYGMNGVAWCNIFVTWCAQQCGISDSIIPYTASCIETYNFYNSQGLTYSTSSDYTPKPGDLVLRGPGDHIGIVEKYENGVLYTIEGNTSGGAAVDPNGGGVYNKSYSDPASSWTCYCSVQYPEESTSGDGSGISTGDGLGNLCFAYETGNQTLGQFNVWYIEDIGDGAGTNYGAMSTNREQAQNMYNYIISNSETFKNKFSGVTFGSSTFVSIWTGSHTAEETAEMEKLQRAWVWNAYGSVAASGTYSFMSRSRALQEVVISRAVNRGASGAQSMFGKAGINSSMTDAEIIDAIYAYEKANITPVYLRERMGLEWEDAKKFL